MLRNRQLAIKLEKADAPKISEEIHKMEIPWDEVKTHANALRRSLKKTAALGVLAVYGFVLLDTVRQVAVARAEHHDNN